MKDFSKMTEAEALYSIGARPAVKGGVQGLNFPVPGKPGKPGQTIFIPASDEKPNCIIASANKRDRVRGARKTRCHDCPHKVWISPSTQEMLRRYPGTPVICVECFMKRVEKEGRVS
jgi:hypothetical protein